MFCRKAFPGNYFARLYFPDPDRVRPPSISPSMLLKRIRSVTRTQVGRKQSKKIY